MFSSFLLLARTVHSRGGQQQWSQSGKWHWNIFCNDLKYFCSFSLNFSAGVWWPGEDWSPVITGSWWGWHLQSSSEHSPQDGSEVTVGAGIHGLRAGLWQPGARGGGGAADLHQRGRGLPSPQPDLRTPHRPQSLYNQPTMDPAIDTLTLTFTYVCKWGVPCLFHEKLHWSFDNPNTGAPA